MCTQQRARVWAAERELEAPLSTIKAAGHQRPSAVLIHIHAYQAAEYKLKSAIHVYTYIYIYNKAAELHSKRHIYKHMHTYQAAESELEAPYIQT